MKKIAYIILFLFGLSLYGLVVRHVYTGGKKLGVIAEPIKTFTSWPLFIRPAIDEATEFPLQFHKTPVEFKKINNLDKDVLVLSTISKTDFKRSIILRNLRTDSIIHTWDIDYFFDKNDRLIHPLLLKNKELFVIAKKMKPSLFKVDSSGNVLWESTSENSPHHSINLSADEKYLWTPGSKLVPSSKRNMFTHKLIRPDGRELLVENNFLLKWNMQTGEIEYLKSVFELFQENNLLYKIQKTPLTFDPFHLNDIEPVTISNKYFQKGDLLLSFRKISAIIHYRPINDSIINYIEGPFAFQHDVDIENDSTIIFFNNNTFFLEYEQSIKLIESTNILDSTRMPSSNIMSYSYKDETFSIREEDSVFMNELFSHTQGLISKIDENMLLIEEQNKGVLWIVKNGEVIYKNVYESQHEGYHHMLNWTRVIENFE